jgi:plasmid stabilization system protein ParE
MMRLYWTPAAAADMQHISDYLKERHPHYRQPALRKLYDSIRSLRQRRIADGPEASQTPAKTEIRPEK